MSKTRVFIYGSCVSRDTFEHLDPEQFELVEYVARQSVLSATTRPVEMLPPPTLESRFQQRMVNGDFTSNLRPLLSQRAGEIDVLLVDLTDERLGVYLLPDGTVVTRTVELIESGAEQSLPQGARHVAFGTQQHFEYWSGAIRALGDTIRNTLPQVAVAILDIPWAEWSENGQQTPDSFGVGAARANPVFRSYVDVATQALGAHIVALDPSEVMSGPHHPWGEAPFHYAENVYLEAVRRLTGAEGRVVWGPGASSQATTGSVRTASTGSHETAPNSRPTPSTGPQDPATPLRAGFSVGDLVQTTWRLSRSTGTHVVEPIRFNASGAVWGNSHKTTWAVDDGYLALTNAKGEIITRFDNPVSDQQGFRLEGQFLLEPEKNIVHVLEPTEFDWVGRKRHPNLTRIALEREISRFKWSVGDHTFGKPTIREPRTSALSIGKFSTLGNNVTFYLSNRRTDSVSTYPFHSLRGHWPSGDRFAPQHREDSPLTIGNDVRIGDNSIVMPGVTIGDGAVVTPGSVVTHDIQPYSIVSGAPAVETGLRFRSHEIESLQSIRWWDWSDEEIDQFLPHMASGIDKFLEAVRRR